MKYFFVIFFLLFLGGCVTDNSLIEKKEKLKNEIRSEQNFRINQASGSARAAEIALNSDPNPNIYSETASKFNSLTVDALPEPSLDTEQFYENILNDLLSTSEKAQKDANETIKRVNDQLINSELKQEDLTLTLEELTNKHIKLLRSNVEIAENEAENLKHNNELKSLLVKLFFGAAVLFALIGLVGGYFLKSPGFTINMVIAAAGFGLCAYYVTQTWFALFAAAIALLLIIGAIYLIFGKNKPESALKKYVKVIKRMSESNDPKEKFGAEILKSEVNQEFRTAKEAKTHKKYINNIKKTIN